MKKFILNCLIFGLFFVIIICIPILVIGQYDNADAALSTNTNIRSLQTKSKFDSLDILFVGNSYCYSAIQPTILDSNSLKSYNLGIATAGIEFYELIINDYLTHVNKYPRFLFLLVSPMTFSSKSDNYASYPIHRYLEKPISNFEIALRFNKYEELLSLYRKSISKSFSNLFSTSKPNSDDVFDTNSKGFVANNSVVTDQLIHRDQHLYTSFAYEKFNPKKLNNMINLTRSLESSGITVVYFELPTNKLRKYFNQDYLQAYESALQVLNRENGLFRIDTALFSDTNYRNIDHMNTSGSVIATHAILEYIQHDLSQK